MATGKKYYWLKLSKDFFKRHDIKIIKSQKNGKDYLLFYLMLLTESIDHDGHLRFNELIPYDVDMLSVITDTDVDVVKSAVKLLQSLKLMELLDDGTIFMTEIQRMMGYETDWAKKKRLQRSGDNVLMLSLNSPFNVRQEKEIELDKELEIDKDKEKDIKDTNVSMSDESDSDDIVSQKIPYSDIANYWNENSKLKEIVSMTPNRKKHINARIKEFGLVKFFEMIDIVSKSSFLRGNNQKGKIWIADFNWCIKNTDNFTKIIEGNFLDEDEKDNYVPKSQSDFEARVAKLRERTGGMSA